MSLLTVNELSCQFGGVHAVRDLNIAIARGTVHSIIGPNGAGKTTLLNLITGIYKPSAGRIVLDGHDVTGLAPHRLAALGIARTFQNLQIFFNMTVIENVMVGRHLRSDLRLIPAFLALPSQRRSESAVRTRAFELLKLLELSEDAARSASALSYGALKRLEVARALAAEPVLLLLDEPAAGLNDLETEKMKQLIRSIAQSGVTVVLIEHDMPLVMEISDNILVLDQGMKLAEGTADEVLRNPAVVSAYLGTAHAA